MNSLRLLPLCLLLGACAQPNPYSAQGVPYPPAPASAAKHFDRSAYPPAPLDYGRYRSWRWSADQLPAGSGWASSPLVAESLANALEQRGLRPAQGDAPGDLRISARVELTEVEWVEPPRTSVGYGHGSYGSDYGVWGSQPLGGRYRQEVLRVRVEFHDGSSGQLVWSGQSNQPLGSDPAQHDEQLREAMRQALSNYPPN